MQAIIALATAIFGKWNSRFVERFGEIDYGKNSDLFEANLNITFESLMQNLSNSDCSNEFYWEKWESTGKKSEGMSIVAPNIVRITDCSIAKLLDVPFEPMEMKAVGIRARVASGKTESLISPNFSFKISHEATNPVQEIKAAKCLLVSGSKQLHSPFKQ